MADKKQKKDVEDWHKPQSEEEAAMREDDGLAPKKHSNLPIKFELGILTKLDRRTEIFKQLRRAYREITDDMGGISSLSRVQVCLAERFCFLECVLKGIEQKIATNPKSKEVETILSRWIQGLNSLTGLAKIIGLSRRARKITDLKTYIKERVK